VDLPNWRPARIVEASENAGACSLLSMPRLFEPSNWLPADSTFRVARGLSLDSNNWLITSDYSTLMPMLVDALPESTTVRISLPSLTTTKCSFTGENGLPGMLITNVPVQFGLTV